jgi:hypothetical protein
MQNFAENMELCEVFTKNIELYEVLPKIELCLSFAKFMELYEVLPKI